MTEPSRTEVSKKLQALIDKSLTREDAAAWAVSLLNDDSIRIRDEAVLDALKFLGGVDLISTDRPYLYMEADFEQELARLRS
jgi:vacuolar-type H+-ATPase subunit B/Vma2